ncbi:unnamed protein product, partial [Acidithrix sp. C25]
VIFLQSQAIILTSKPLRVDREILKGPLLFATKVVKDFSINPKVVRG